MLTIEKKSELYNCIMRQFPDPGLYRASRIVEWLHTNGYSLRSLGYGSFRGLAEDFCEMFAFQDDNNDEFIEVKRWQTGENQMIGSIELQHPADSFFGSANIILNDDIIEMTQQSLYALTKILGNGYTVQQMKQEIYRKFDEAKTNQKLNFFGERYVFPIDCCPDGMMVNGIITKNLSPHGKSLYFAFDKTQIYCTEYQAARQKLPHSAVPEEEKERIYLMLTKNFPCGQPLYMSAVSKFLSCSGIDKNRYGFYKMKDFLSELDFLEMDYDHSGIIPQVMVTIHAKDEKKVSAKENAQPFMLSERGAKAFSSAGYSAKRGEMYVHGKPEYGDYPVPSGRLTDFCNLPAKPMTIFEGFLKERGYAADFSSISEELNEDFDKARAERSVRIHDSRLVFFSRYLKEDCSNVEITLKPSAYEGKKWFLYFVDTEIREKNQYYISPGKQLENFAFLGNRQHFLEELAAKAVDEEWDFNDAPVKSYQILNQYIKYTFSRLIRENKVCISSDKQFAAFNTGLADNHYDDIYACFVPNISGNETEWKFTGFCTAASGGLGKQLVNYFNPLPAPPTYFSRNEDLFFDHTKQLHTDFDHIIIDNIKRLPLQFLYDQFFDNAQARELVERIRGCRDTFRRGELYERLKTIILDNSCLFVRIKNRIKDSIELARKRVRWNYKTAIPSYFPKRDTMSLMLPLALLDESKPDVALVVELTRSGSYQGQTILTLPQAYVDARLICRLTGDWLVPERIFTNSTDSEEQEFAAVEEITEAE